MATTLDTCDDLIAQLDTNGSEGHSLEERKESGWNKRKEYESDNIFNQYICLHSSSPVGGLALELWWDILEIVDDPRALIATGCTCKTLRDVVREIITKRTYVMRLDDLLSDPTGGYFLSYADVSADEFSLWLSISHPTSLGLRRLKFIGGRVVLRSQTRSALSQLKSADYLTLQGTHFFSFTDFAQTVCALPDLEVLVLERVTVNEDSKSYRLEGRSFACDVHLNKLSISDCAFGESHPIWSLLTAPLLSDSLEHIHAKSDASDPELALQQLYIAPAVLRYASLRRLNRLQFKLSGPSYSCEAVCGIVLGLLSRSPAGRVTAIEIDYACVHSPPCLNTWEALVTTLDSCIAVADFATLKTVSIYLEMSHSFNVDNICAMDSQSRSPEWTEKFTVSRMVFTDNGSNEILPFSQQMSKTGANVEACPRGVTLSIQHGAFGVQLHRGIVVYTRHPDTVAFELPCTCDSSIRFTGPRFYHLPTTLWTRHQDHGHHWSDAGPLSSTSSTYGLPM